MSKMKYLHATALLMLCVFVMAGVSLAATTSWKVVMHTPTDDDPDVYQLYDCSSRLLWGANGSVAVQTENNGTSTIWQDDWKLVSVQGVTLSAIPTDRWGISSIAVPGPVEYTGYYAGTGSNLLRGQFDFIHSIKAPPITTLQYVGAVPTAKRFDCNWQLADDTDTLITTDIANAGIYVGPFSDCLPPKSTSRPGGWAEGWIAELAGRVPAIVTGTSPTLYAPATKVDRASMAVFLARSLQLPMPAGYMHYFSDVSIGHWARPWIEAMYEAGLVGGFEDGSYRPALIVKRDAMAVFVARAMCSPSAVPAASVVTFTDDVPNTYWAYDEIEYCVAQGVVGGYTPTSYRPTVDVTRDQMAVFVYRGFMAPTGAKVVLAGPAVTAVDPSAATYDGWTSAAVGEAAAPGYAYIGIDSVRVTAGDVKTFDVKFELRSADTPNDEATGDYTATVTVDPTTVTPSSSRPYFYVPWKIPATLDEGDYILVTTVDGTVLARKPAFTVGPIEPPSPPDELAIYPTTRQNPQPTDCVIASGSYADLQADDDSYVVINSNSAGAAGYQVYCMFDTSVTASTMLKAKLEVVAMMSEDDAELLQIRTDGRNAANRPVGSINTWAADVEQTFTWESAGKRKVADCFYTAGRGIVTVYGYPAGMTGGAYDLSIDMLKYTATLR